jgi:hypothetical protein
MTETKEDFFKWPPVPGQYRSPDGHVGIGARSHARLADVRSVADWIRLNEAALVDYWEYRISTAQFIRHCEPCRQAEHSRSRLCSAKPVRALTSKLSRYLDNSSQPLQAALGKSGCES